MLAAVNLITAVPAAASAGVTSSLAAQANRTAASSPFTASPAFANLIADALGQGSPLEAQAQSGITSSITSPMTSPMISPITILTTGSEADLHQALSATQKAGQAFDLALAVRNEAVQAYQSVMAMQF